MTWSGYSEQGQGSQERGPGTFAVNPPRAVQGQAASGAAGGEVRGGVRFVGRGTASVGNITPGNTQAPQAVSVKDDTLSILMKLGEKTLAPRIAAIKQQAEVDGAVRHASGVALEEIVNEQPWYANVFGTAPAVEGARTYAARAATAKFVQANLEDMENLSMRPPGDIAPILTDKMKEYLTGDPGVDSIIQAEMVAQIPTLVKAHTKAHVAYMQKKADTAHYNAMTAAAEKYRAIMGQHELVTAGDAEIAQAELAETFLPPTGRNPDSHWKNLTNVVIDQATKGNSQFLAAATRVGMLEALPPDYRDVVKAGIVKAAPGIFSKQLSNDTQLLTAVAALITNPPDTPEEIQAEWARVNAIMAERTGIPVELVKFSSEGDLLRYVANDQQRDLREEARNRTAVEASILKQAEAVQKAQDEARANTLYKAAIERGFDDPKVNIIIESKGAARALGLNDTQASAVWRSVLNSTTPQQFGALLSRTPNESNSAIKDHLGTWLSAAARPQDKEAWMGSWSQLLTVAGNVPFSPTMDPLAIHMGAEKTALVREAQRLVNGEADPITAVTIATTEAPARRAAAALKRNGNEEMREVATETAEKALDESIGATDAFRSWRSFTGGRKPQQRQIDMLAGILSQQTSGMMNSTQADVNLTLRSMTNEGSLTVAGGSMVMNLAPQDALAYPLHKAIGFNSIGQEDAAYETLGILIDERLRERGYGDTTAAAAGRTLNPFNQEYSFGKVHRATGFEASGYSISRLPRSPGDTNITFIANYEQDGVPKQLVVTSEEVKQRYQALVNSQRKPASVGGVPVDQIGTDSIIAPSGALD